MRNKLQNIFQYLILVTSFPPFTYVYRFVYFLSIYSAVFFLRKTPGLVSIYLRRGSATREIVYGLSDIDLLVLLSEEHIQSKEKVGKIYDRLSAFIPLFGDREKELIIHSISEFQSLYKEHNSYRYRFDEGKHQWKLLYGQDFIQTLDPLEDIELNLLAAEELKVWWAFLTAEINPDPSVPKFRRKYLWYKAISEAAKIYVFTCHSKKIYSRAAALKEIQEYIPAEFQTILLEIAGYIKNLANRKFVLLDEHMQLFIWLATQAYDKTKLELPFGHHQIEAKIGIPPPDANTSEDTHQITAKALLPISPDLEPYIERIVIIPQIEFDVDVLNNPDIDSFYLALILKTGLPVSLMANILKTIHSNPAQGNIEAFMVSEGKLALSLSASRPQMCIKSRITDPFFFSRLENNGMKSGNLPYYFEKTLRIREARIRNILSNKEIYKIRNIDLCRFFWAAARTKLLVDSFSKLEVSIPVNARQIAYHLAAAFPDKAEWFHNFYFEYVRESKYQKSNIHLFFTDAIDFLYCMDKRGPNKL